MPVIRNRSDDDADAAIMLRRVCTGPSEDSILAAPDRTCIEATSRGLEFAIGDTKSVKDVTVE